MNRIKNNPFFILTMGRSGTQFLSSLLNTAENTKVIHEHPLDLLSYQFVYKNPYWGFKYFEYIRNPYIMKNLKNYQHYGEVNSVLRRHLPAIKYFYPNAKLFHLIRDGRFVIRSIMSRKTMQWYDPITKFVIPPKNSLMRNKWIYMSRFERVCWYWAEENDYISLFTDNLIKFENIIKDYNYMKNNLLNHITLDISFQKWQNEINKPKNITKQYKFPHPDNWTKDMKHIFYKICGKQMKQYNYPLC